MTEPKPVSLQRTRGRPKGSKNKVTEDFDQAYRKYSKEYGCDPVEFLFRVMTGADQSEEWGTSRLTAAIALIKRKVPELKSLDANIKQQEQKQLVIVWDDGDRESHDTLQAETVSEAITH